MKITDKKPQLREITTITPYHLNAKKHDDNQVKKLANSIQKFGWRGNPILVDRDGVIIAGHGRRLAAISLGITRVPVVVEEDMTADEARAFRLVDNRSAISDIDTDIFREELEAIDLDVLRGIFDDKELEFSTADLGEMSEDSFVEDLDIVVAEQQRELDAQIQSVGSRRHALIKAFGFKDVSVENARTISEVMALVSSVEKCDGEAALLHIFNAYAA